MNELIPIMIDLQKSFTMFEMVEMKEYMMCMEAECKVYVESGTYEDLEYLYNEAVESTSDQKKNILDKIFKVVSEITKKIFGKVKEALGFKNIGEKIIKFPKKLAGFTKDVLKKILNMFKALPKKSITKKSALVALGAGIAGIGVYVKSVQAKKQLQDQINKINAADYSEYVKMIQEITMGIQEQTNILEDVNERDNIEDDYASSTEKDANDTVAKTTDASANKRKYVIKMRSNNAHVIKPTVKTEGVDKVVSGAANLALKSVKAIIKGMLMVISTIVHTVNGLIALLVSAVSLTGAMVVATARDIATANRTIASM
jgi:hypothetical protein|nr:MAG TPA: hypothetical protein [Caudoviricetes sp.]